MALPPMRAANRRKASVGGKSMYPTGGKKLANREPEHHEAGFRGRMKEHMSHGSPASRGASMGPGPMPGAGELPAPGLGRAGARHAGMDETMYPTRPTPSGDAPKGMSVYTEE